MKMAREGSWLDGGVRSILAHCDLGIWLGKSSTELGRHFLYLFFVLS